MVTMDCRDLVDGRLVAPVSIEWAKKSQLDSVVGQALRRPELCGPCIVSVCPDEKAPSVGMGPFKSSVFRGAD